MIRATSTAAASARRLSKRFIHFATAAAAAHAAGDALATAAVRATTTAKRRRLEAQMDATGPLLDRAVEQMTAAHVARVNTSGNGLAGRERLA